MASPRLHVPAYVLAGVGALPVLVWWLGWHPGFASSDTIDQWRQVLQGPLSDHHPAIHTMFLGWFSLAGRDPGLVTLVQLVLFGVLLVYGARALVRAGVPAWLAVGAAWLLGLSPAIAPTTLTLWKDIPFGLLFHWAWIELLGMATDPPPPAAADAPLPPTEGRHQDPPPPPTAGTPPASEGRVETSGGSTWIWPAVRLGIALAGVWLFRGNGPITVIPILLVMAIVAHRRWRIPLTTAVTAAVLVFLVTGPLYAAAEVVPAAAVPAEVFLPDVAASYQDEPHTFTAADIDMLDDVAPLEVWTGRYECDESTPLLFDPRFNHQPVRAEPMEWLELELSVLIRDTDNVIEHRACAASYLYVPWTPNHTFLHTPPYALPENDVGLVREPMSDNAFAVTDWYWKWAEDHPWLTWRPAIVIWPALAAVVLFALRARRFLLPSALFLAHLANVTLTSPAQEFRYAYPLYLVAVFTIPLIWPATRPQGRHLQPAGTRRRLRSARDSTSEATLASQDSASA